MAEFTADIVARGITHCAFGDLFLEDIRQYRENLLKGTGITPVFPLWKQPTDQLIRDMLAGGLKTVITCVDPKQLAPAFSGRWLDEAFLAELPESVDPCGENGEFHSMVVDGPMFSVPIAVKVGETIERQGFYYTDILPG